MNVYSIVWVRYEKVIQQDEDGDVIRILLVF